MQSIKTSNKYLLKHVIRRKPDKKSARQAWRRQSHSSDVRWILCIRAEQNTAYDIYNSKSFLLAECLLKDILIWSTELTYKINRRNPLSSVNILPQSNSIQNCSAISCAILSKKFTPLPEEQKLANAGACFKGI